MEMFCRILLSTLSVLCAAFTYAGCSKRQTTYDRLCQIYEEFDSQPNTSELAVTISKQVESKLPDIYADYHVVMTAGTEERYEMFRMLARERENQNDWACAAIRTRYPPEKQE